MRFASPVFVVVFLLILGLVGTVDARGGKGGGGGGGGHASRGGGQKFSGGGQGGAGKHQADQSHQPAKDKVASGKPAKEKTAKEKTAKDKPGKSAKEKTDSDSPDSGEVAETPNKKEKQLANFQRQRDKKISQAGHLRQIAERNGNANLAANADRMEAQAHEQYAQKVSHLEKFGVTDPELDLDGDGLADPYVPDTEPLTDPVGTLEGLLPGR